MSKTREFIKLKERVKRDYLGKPVPTEYKKIFGKKYNKKDILPLAKKIAKSRGVQIYKNTFYVEGGVKEDG